MDQQVKTKWLNRLRSNKYRQGKHWLKFTDEEGVTCHCCLGVLCEIYVEENGPIKTAGPTKEDDLRGPRKGVPFGDDYKVLPAEVKEWAGIKEFDGGVVKVEMEGQNSSTYLPVLNDHYGFDFKQIADVIEEQL